MHMLLPALKDVLHKDWRSKRFFLKLKRRLCSKRNMSDYELRVRKQTPMMIFIPVVALSFIFSLTHFQSLGKETASQLRTRLERKSFLQHEIISVTINGVAKKLMFLGCGARNCVGVDPESRGIHYFPQNGHSYPLPVEKAKQAQ
jgi:hypothetical protein